MDMMAGERFGRLTVIQDRGARYVVCKCDCGAIKITTRKNLRRGDTRSCGCLHREVVKGLLRKHGDTGCRLHRIWKGMMTRTNNKNRKCAKNYALRGISVCDEWSEYAAFKEWALANGYAENLTIDRINNDGPYSPDNCRWSTYKEQCRNKRNTHIFLYGGKTYRTIKDLCAGLCVEYRRVQSRLRKGWTLEESVSLGLCKTGPRKEGQGRTER